MHPCQEITSCMDGGSTVLLQPPCSISGHSWGDISTMRSSLLTGYIFLQVFPGGLLVTLRLQFLCCEDFRGLVFPFPWCPDVAPPQDLHAAVAPSAVRATVLGMFVMGSYCSHLWLIQAVPTAIALTGKFFWLGLCRKDLFPLLSLLSAQAHKPLLLHLPGSNFRSVHKTLVDILAGSPQYLKAAHGW